MVGPWKTTYVDAHRNGRAGVAPVIVPARVGQRMLLGLSFIILSKKFVALSALGLGILALVVDPMVLAAAAAFVIGALATAAGVIIKAFTGAKIELLEKHAEILRQGAVISRSVDGMTTAATAKRTADEDTMSALRQQLADYKKRDELVAQAKAAIDISKAVAEAAIAGATAPAAPVVTPALVATSVVSPEEKVK